MGSVKSNSNIIMGLQRTFSPDYTITTLYALKKRMKKEEGWKKYIVGATGVFALLFIVSKL